MDVKLTENLHKNDNNKRDETRGQSTADRLTGREQGNCQRLKSKHGFDYWLIVFALIVLRWFSRNV